MTRNNSLRGILKKLHLFFSIVGLFVSFIVAGSPGHPLYGDSGNMLANGDFSRGVSDWNLASFSGGAARCSVERGELKVEIITAGKEAHSVLINQRGLTMETGKAYRVAFVARSAPGGKKLFVKVGLAREPWTAYSGYEAFTLDAVPTRCAFEFSMSQPTDRQAYLEFHLGTDDKDVFLADVTLEEILPETTHVSIAFAEGGEPFRVRGYGILLSMSERQPDDRLVVPLKPSLVRCGNFSVYQRAKRLNAQYMYLLYGEFPGIYRGGRLDKNGNWPGDGNHWEAWDAYVTNVIQQARRQGCDDVIWEVWNEPDIDFFWKRSHEQFLLTYEHTVKIIRQLSPKATVTGPGFALFDEKKITEFLKFADERQVLPDIINWHEISHAPDGIPERVDKIRAYLKKSGIAIDRFMFPEIGHQDFQFSPGNAVSFMANIHRARIAASAKSCWADPLTEQKLDNCFNASLDGLLHPDSYKPRSTWWCYQSYAQMSGAAIHFPVLDKTLGLDGIAACDREAPKAFLLLGRTQANHVIEGRSPGRRAQNIVLEIKNLPDGLVKANGVHVVVKKIPDSGPEALKEPLLVFDSDDRVSGGTLIVTLPGMGIEDVYSIVLTNPQNAR